MGIEVTDLVISIGHQTLVDHISFSVESSGRLGIIGESGSGKTLTMLAILGLLPQEAVVSGSILWNGRQLVGLAPKEIAQLRGRELGIVFQDPSSALNPIRTVGSQIGESLRVHYKLSRAELDERVRNAARDVGLSDVEELVTRYPHQLSGGQRQRVAIAMAIATGPRLIVADEPTTALDVTVQAGILDLFDELVGSLGSSLIFVTHDITLLTKVVPRALVMAGGRIVEEGPLGELLSAPKHPVTARLIAAARATSWDGE
jgi:peptide/nickel transport system ATP-binding protein